MTDARISELDSKETLDGTELVEIVDTGDNSISPTGTNKQTTSQAIADLVNGGGIPEAPNDGKQYGRQNESWTEIPIPDSETILIRKEVPVTYDGSSFQADLTDYQEGTRVVVLGSGMRSATVTDGAGISCYINGDTNATNYHTQRNDGNNNSNVTSEVSGNQPAVATGANPAAQYASDFEMTIDNYADATYSKVVRATSGSVRGADNINSSTRTTLHNNGTAPVTSLTIANVDGDDLSGDVRVYIEKQGVVPMLQTGGGGLTQGALQTGDFTAVSGTIYPVADPNNSATITMPASPSDGAVVSFFVTGVINWLSNGSSLFFDGNGKSLDGITDVGPPLGPAFGPGDGIIGMTFRFVAALDNWQIAGVEATGFEEGGDGGDPD